MTGDNSPSAEALSAAARNLLCECAELAAGDEIVICHEDPRHGWYDEGVIETVAREAERLGLHVRRCEAMPPEEDQPRHVVDLLRSSANIIFFARIGDLGRFDDRRTQGRRVMVYTRTARDLASEFGRVPHRAMIALKKAMDAVLADADAIEITCPNGTRVSGRAPNRTHGEAAADVTTRRFPLGVPAPVPAGGFSGRVALTDALTPTGNRTYDPPVLPLSSPVFGLVEAGRIAGFEGDPAEVAKVEAHYEAVAATFGIEPFVVHSWHAGLHPGCRFFGAEGQDLDYWSNTVFSSPRLLHFHTCGTSAPGEIAWNIVNATVLVDGVALWDRGRLNPHAFAPLAGSVAADASLARLF